MDPEETFITLKEHADEIKRVGTNNTALWDYVHGTENGQWPEGHEPPPQCIDERLDRLEERVLELEKENNSLKKRLVWALTATDNKKQP